MLMLTTYQKFIFISAIMNFTDTARIRMTVRFWVFTPDGPDAIYIFTITEEILVRSLPNFHCPLSKRHMKIVIYATRQE